MILFLLLESLALLWFVCYYVFYKDIVCPTMLFLTGYLVSCFVSFLQVQLWDINLSWSTYFYLMFGIILFVVPGILVSRLYEPIKDSPCPSNAITELNQVTLWASLCLCLITTILSVVNIILVGESLGVNGSFFDCVREVRELYFSSPVEKNLFWIFVNQCQKTVNIASYVIAFYLAKDFVCSRSSRPNPLLTSSFFLCIAVAFLDSGRTGVLREAFAPVVFYFVFHRLYFKESFELDFLSISKALFSVFVALLIFWLFLGLGGRPLGNFFSNIGIYLGGSIPLFDSYLKSPIQENSLFGAEVFYSMWSLLKRLNFVDFPFYDFNLEFRWTSTNFLMGNIYPSFRSYLQDFGILGLIFLPCILSTFLHWLYYSSINCLREKSFSVRMVFYGALGYFVFADFVHCFFYSLVLSFWLPQIIFGIFVFNIILTKK